MAYTTIDDPSAYFNTLLYSGNAGTNALTNSANAGNFQPDWLWIKCRNSAVSHNAFDTSRQTSGESTLVIRPNSNDAESNVSGDGMTSIDSNGFTLNGGGSGGAVNESGKTYVAWQWAANGGTTASNSDGGISSTVQVNSTAGFSIILYTGSSDGGSTSTSIGHGLGDTPDWILYKRRSGGTRDWMIFHQSTGSKGMILNSTSAGDTGSSIFGGNNPTSTTIPVGFATETNTNGESHIAYAFAQKQGYSKFGGYKGNGNADGPFVYTGFKPAWLMTKRTDSSDHWRIVDNKRETSNDGSMQGLKANADESESDSGSRGLDFLSNGFKVRTTDPDSNANGGTYIYMAFAEHPFVSSKGVPVTAK